MIANPQNFRLKYKKMADKTFCPWEPEKKSGNQLVNLKKNGKCFAVM